MNKAEDATISRMRQTNIERAKTAILKTDIIDRYNRGELRRWELLVVSVELLVGETIIYEALRQLTEED